MGQQAAIGNSKFLFQPHFLRAPGESKVARMMIPTHSHFLRALCESKLPRMMMGAVAAGNSNRR